MKEKTQYVIISLLLIQIVVLFWGVWYITTDKERKIEKDCANFINSFIDLNPKISADTLQKIHNDCHEQGGSKEWEQSKNMNRISDEISDMAKRLGVN